MNGRESETLLPCDRRVGLGAGEGALVARARAGDASAFEELYVRCRDQTYTLCLSLCADPEEAQDLLQDTFVRAYRFLPSFRGEAQFTTWLHRITVNLYHDATRRKQRQAAAVPEPTPSREGGQETAGQVRAVLALLQPNHRVVLGLRYSQGLSYQEMAEVLHWSLGRVKITLHRAKAAFRDAYLQDQGGLP